MAARERGTGRFRIGRDERGWPTIGSALSVAQNRAIRAGEPWSVGVFENGEIKVARVERHADGTITTTKLKEQT